MSRLGNLGQRHPEELAGAVFAQDDVRHLPDDVGVLGSHVVVFVDVGGQVIQAWHAAYHHQLPVAHAQAYLVRFVEFPVEEVVLGLPFVLSQQGGGEGDAVEAVAFELLVEVFLGELLVADELAEGGHHVVEGQLVVIDLSALDVSGPPGDEGHADASFVALAFQAAQLAVASEECRVRTAFLVGAVVAAEDDGGVLVQPLFYAEVRRLGYNIPPLVNAYMSLSPTMRMFGTAINTEFGNVEETGILIAVDEILVEKRIRHIQSYIENEAKQGGSKCF